MKLKLLVISSSLFLTACGGDSAENTSPKDSQVSQKQQATNANKHQDSQLAQFMSAETICDALPTSTLAALFQTTETIETSGGDYRERYSCSYSWNKSDKAEREKLMMENIMQTAQGKAEALPMRLKSPNNQITLTLLPSKKTAANFMPPKLTEEQLQARIEAAKKAANKRLTEEQKALAGDAANSMVERLMQQSNQNVTVDGIGDAAFWSETGSGGLNVLVGEIEIYIGPMIADTAAEDLENAKKIAGLLLK